MNRSWPGKGVSWGEPSRSDMPAAAVALNQDKERALLRVGRGKRGTLTTNTEDSPIYSKTISGWMATHEGRMPGVVPTSAELEDDIVVDTPYLNDVAKNGISPWGRNRGVTPPNAEPIQSPSH